MVGNQHGMSFSCEVGMGGLGSNNGEQDAGDDDTEGPLVEGSQV